MIGVAVIPGAGSAVQLASRRCDVFAGEQAGELVRQCGSERSRLRSGRSGRPSRQGPNDKVATLTPLHLAVVLLRSTLVTGFKNTLCDHLLVVWETGVN